MHTDTPSSISRRYRTHTISAVFLLPIILILTSCGGGGGSDNTAPYEPKLYEAIYSGGSYRYANQYFITGAPADIDWYRWGMLNDGADYRLYFMKTGSNDTLYQFAYNAASGDYEF
jgi:hypothetical protein